MHESRRCGRRRRQTLPFSRSRLGGRSRRHSSSSSCTASCTASSNSATWRASSGPTSRQPRRPLDGETWRDAATDPRRHGRRPAAEGGGAHHGTLVTGHAPAVRIARRHARDVRFVRVEPRDAEPGTRECVAHGAPVAVRGPRDLEAKRSHAGQRVQRLDGARLVPHLPLHPELGAVRRVHDWRLHLDGQCDLRGAPLHLGQHAHLPRLGRVVQGRVVEAVPRRRVRPVQEQHVGDGRVAVLAGEVQRRLPSLRMKSTHEHTHTHTTACVSTSRRATQRDPSLFFLSPRAQSHLVGRPGLRPLGRSEQEVNDDLVTAPGRHHQRRPAGLQSHNAAVILQIGGVRLHGRGSSAADPSRRATGGVGVRGSRCRDPATPRRVVQRTASWTFGSMPASRSCFTAFSSPSWHARKRMAGTLLIAARVGGESGSARNGHGPA